MVTFGIIDDHRQKFARQLAEATIPMVHAKGIWADPVDTTGRTVDSENFSVQVSSSKPRQRPGGSVVLRASGAAPATIVDGSV